MASPTAEGVEGGPVVSQLGIASPLQGEGRGGGVPLPGWGRGWPEAGRGGRASSSASSIVGHLAVTVIPRHHSRERHRRAISLMGTVEREETEAEGSGLRPSPRAGGCRVCARRDRPGAVIARAGSPPSPGKTGGRHARDERSWSRRRRGNPGAGSSRRKAEAAAALEKKRPRPFGPGGGRPLSGPKGGPSRSVVAGGWTADEEGGAVAPVCGAGEGRARGRHERRAAAPRARLRLAVGR